MPWALENGCTKGMCMAVAAAIPGGAFIPGVQTMCKELLKETDLCNQLKNIFKNYSLPNDNSTAIKHVCDTIGMCDTTCMAGSCQKATMGESCSV